MNRRRVPGTRSTRWPAPRASWIAGIALAAALGVAIGPQTTTARAQGTPAPAAATQTSEGGQVTVRVTWQGPASGLVFHVAMDTHAVNLDQYDLRALAVLRIGKGADVAPAAWDAPNGGHHREGTLTFPAQGSAGKALLGPDVREMTLSIRNVAGVPERTFRWTW